MIEARIQSIGRATALLNGMASGDWVALGELARRAELGKTTACNLVGALVDVGLVEHDERAGAYRLSLQHLVFGKAVERRLDIAGMVKPHLIRLCAETRETVNLALPCPTDAIIVESLEGSQMLRVSSYTGTRAAYHSTACGRALLAWQPEHFRKRIFALGPLQPATANTITDIARLEALLEQCRTAGWTTELEENEVGGACVAAPIFGPHGGVVASVSVAGPSARYGPAVIEQLGELLLRRVGEMTRALAGGGTVEVMAGREAKAK